MTFTIQDFKMVGIKLSFRYLLFYLETISVIGTKICKVGLSDWQTSYELASYLKLLPFSIHIVVIKIYA